MRDPRKIKVEVANGKVEVEQGVEVEEGEKVRWEAPRSHHLLIVFDGLNSPFGWPLLSVEKGNESVTMTVKDGAAGEKGQEYPYRIIAVNGRRLKWMESGTAYESVAHPFSRGIEPESTPPRIIVMGTGLGGRVRPRLWSGDACSWGDVA